uniref:LSM14 domain-containing protein n=1 Tax=Panagrellus redivivus TaxID=6233 RepID=A0A7E4W6V0_PANRE
MRQVQNLTLSWTGRRLDAFFAQGSVYHSSIVETMELGSGAGSTNPDTSNKGNHAINTEVVNKKLVFL